MAEPVKIDILQMELDQNLPNWLDRPRISEERRRAIMDKHRRKAMLQKRLQRLKERVRGSGP